MKIAMIGAGYDPGGQAVRPIWLSQRIVISRCRPVLQRAPRETNHPARRPLGRGEFLACVNDGLTEILCGQALCFR